MSSSYFLNLSNFSVSSASSLSSSSSSSNSSSSFPLSPTTIKVSGFSSFNVSTSSSSSSSSSKSTLLNQKLLLSVDSSKKSNSKLDKQDPLVSRTIALFAAEPHVLARVAKVFLRDVEPTYEFLWKGY